MPSATIQTIRNVRQHPNADALSLCDVLGWQVVIKKDEFKDGDKVVYIEVDSTVLPRSEFSFLENKGYRIKPIKLRGQVSNGICFPLSLLPSDFSNIVDGVDVSELVGSSHYEKPIPTEMAGKMVGGLPSFLQMTDEPNIRTYPDMIQEFRGKEFYITRKDDGSSATFFLKDGIFGVCSRKIHLAEDDSNIFWKMAKKYNVENCLRSYFSEADSNVALQGEVVGPGVNGNNLGLKEHELHAFTLFHIPTRSYFPFYTLRDFCMEQNIPMVSLIEMGDKFQYDLPYLIKLSNTLKYPNGLAAEGLVLRPIFPAKSQVVNRVLSGKVINENYEN